ncbi:hypothetical protein B0H17DRAFT_1141582 [Mycena rosella]|uniref:Uncharacterized protein n=1 Tax=Mycena rosella TaxID=1033263 RepID=A0AAD7CZG2_MYCRO|nr:hypothetical protein B0H17DRAFT_1141582 [Mycena rosella]
MAADVLVPEEPVLPDISVPSEDCTPDAVPILKEPTPPDIHEISLQKCRKILNLVSPRQIERRSYVHCLVISQGDIRKIQGQNLLLQAAAPPKPFTTSLKVHPLLFQKAVGKRCGGVIMWRCFDVAVPSFWGFPWACTTQATDIGGEVIKGTSATPGTLHNQQILPIRLEFGHILLDDHSVSPILLARGTGPPILAPSVPPPVGDLF